MSYTFHNDLKAKNISYGSSRTASSIKFICLHATGNLTDKAKSNANYYATGNTRAAGAHYFVDDNDVYQSIDDLKIAWAVGGNKYPSCATSGGGTLYGVVTNANSISIEMCSTNGKPTEKTLQNAVELAKKLMKKYNIPKSHLCTHFQIVGKNCPYWDGWCDKTATEWKKFLKRFDDDTTTTTTTTSIKKAYTGSYPSGTIKLNSTGDEVKKLQKYLNWYGNYKLTVDGNAGAKTIAAIKDFQKDNKLTVDGIFGANCLKVAKTIKK